MRSARHGLFLLLALCGYYSQVCAVRSGKQAATEYDCAEDDSDNWSEPFADSEDDDDAEDDDWNYWAWEERREQELEEQERAGRAAGQQQLELGDVGERARRARNREAARRREAARVRARQRARAPQQSCRRRRRRRRGAEHGVCWQCAGARTVEIGGRSHPAA